MAGKYSSSGQAHNLQTNKTMQEKYTKNWQSKEHIHTEPNSSVTYSSHKITHSEIYPSTII
jgi:hypothetical protein